MPTQCVNHRLSCEPLHMYVHGHNYVLQTPAVWCIVIIIAWLVLEWTLPFTRVTSIEGLGLLVENTSAEMSPVARQVNAG